MGWGKQIVNKWRELFFLVKSILLKEFFIEGNYFFFIIKKHPTKGGLLLLGKNVRIRTLCEMVNRQNNRKKNMCRYRNDTIHNSFKYSWSAFSLLYSFILPEIIHVQKAINHCGKQSKQGQKSFITCGISSCILRPKKE